MFYLKSFLCFQMSTLISYFKLQGTFSQCLFSWVSLRRLWWPFLPSLGLYDLIQLTVPTALPSTPSHPLATQKTHLHWSKMHHEPFSDNHVPSSWAPVTHFQLHTWHFYSNGPLSPQSHLKLNLTPSIPTKELPCLTSISVNGFDILPTTQPSSL